MQNTQIFLSNTDYYIWWLKNCSTISVEQIQKEVDPLIEKLNTLYLTTGDFYPELDELEELRLLGYNIPLFNSFKELEKVMEEDYQEQFREQYREEYREMYREQYRE